MLNHLVYQAQQAMQSPPSTALPHPSDHPSLKPLAPTLLRQLLIRDILKRALGVRAQALECIVAAALCILLVRLLRSLAGARGGPLLRARLVLRVGRLAAGVGGGHFFGWVCRVEVGCMCLMGCFLRKLCFDGLDAQR